MLFLFGSVHILAGDAAACQYVAASWELPPLRGQQVIALIGV
jgi:hypothetical protein